MFRLKKLNCKGSFTPYLAWHGALWHHASPQRSAMHIENSTIKAATAAPYHVVQCRDTSRWIRCERTLNRMRSYLPVTVIDYADNASMETLDLTATCLSAMTVPLQLVSCLAVVHEDQQQ